MSKQTLRIIANFTAKKNKESELRAVLLTLVEPTRRETGCRLYELWENLDTPGQFTFVEEWESQETLDAHLQTDHILAARSRFAELVEGGLDLRRYQLIG